MATAAGSAGPNPTTTGKIFHRPIAELPELHLEGRAGRDAGDLPHHRPRAVEPQGRRVPRADRGYAEGPGRQGCQHISIEEIRGRRVAKSSSFGRIATCGVTTGFIPRSPVQRPPNRCTLSAIMVAEHFACERHKIDPTQHAASATNEAKIKMAIVRFPRNTSIVVLSRKRDLVEATLRQFHGIEPG